MNAGHFGLAAGVKAGAPRLPLWSLMVSTYLLDIVFIILFAFGIESYAPIDPANPGYGAVMINALYTHSLVGALLISAAAGLLANFKWGRRGGLVIAGVVFSHWLLDLIVHRPDLPILPGNAGNLPLLGFGLWNYPLASGILELILVVGGAVLYIRSAMRLPVPPGADPNSQRRRVFTASLVTGGLLLLVLVTDLLGL
jgi:membrane-bound metal-dependent hydrolase YbcI (DUF457 family)